jgi:hypothetical protein
MASILRDITPPETDVSPPLDASYQMLKNEYEPVVGNYYYARIKPYPYERVLLRAKKTESAGGHHQKELLSLQRPSGEMVETYLPVRKLKSNLITGTDDLPPREANYPMTDDERNPQINHYYYTDIFPFERVLLQERNQSSFSLQRPSGEIVETSEPLFKLKVESVLTAGRIKSKKRRIKKRRTKKERIKHMKNRKTNRRRIK